MTTNEAAERLRGAYQPTNPYSDPIEVIVSKMLTAERRATVERIRAAMYRDVEGVNWNPSIEAVIAILDEEAAR